MRSSLIKMTKELDKLIENLTKPNFPKGEEIKLCPSCNTLSLKRIYYDNVEYYSNYRCDNCPHTEIENWKQNEIYISYNKT